MKRITKNQVQRMLTELVKEFGEDYAYQAPEHLRNVMGGYSGWYWHTPPSGDPAVAPELPSEGGTPGCIAGHVFHRLGVTPEALRREEGNTSNHVCETGVGNLDWDAEATWLLRRAQAVQDAGYTWGLALKVGLGSSDIVQQDDSLLVTLETIDREFQDKLRGDR